jgi:hypothetical protein
MYNTINYDIMILLLILLTLSVLLFLMISIDRLIIPNLDKENKFFKWWNKHVITKINF